MGNENSATTETISDTSNEPIRHSVSPNNQPPVRSLPNSTYPMPTERNPAINDKTNYTSQTQSRSKVREEPALSHNYHQQPSGHQSKQPKTPVPVQQSSYIANGERSAPGLAQKPVSPAVIRQQISSSTQNHVLPPHVSASGFQKAPLIQLNYVVKSSDDKSLHTYESNDITVMRRTSSESVAYGNRWYDGGSNKN